MKNIVKQVFHSLFSACCLSAIMAESGVVADRCIRRYDTESWPLLPSFPGIATNWTPILPASLLQSSGISTNREIHASGSVSLMFVFSSAPDMDFDLRTFEAEDFASSKRALMTELGGLETTVPLPRGTNGLERLGDVCYGVLDSPSLVLFVRNNVFVSCFSRLSPETVTNLLFGLDRQIVDALQNP